MIKQCVICGKTFETNYSHKITCSPKCSAEHHRIQKRDRERKLKNYVEPPPRQCVICGKIFTPRKPNQITCSKECRAEHQRILVRDYSRVHTKHVDYPPRQCVICGKTFKPKSKVHITCSHECSAENNRRKQIKVRKSIQVNYEPLPPTTYCQNCGKPTTPDIMQGRFCSDDCILQFFTPPRLMRLAKLLEDVNK